MRRAAYVPYAPLNVLKAFADDLWIVDGPEIGMRMAGLSMPFSTRMTVVRLPSGDLWVHSPIAWEEGLSAALDALGPVRHLVAPNTLHYWYLPDWQARYPLARSYGAPDLAERAKRPVRLDETLGAETPPSFEGVFAQCVAPGSLLTEVVFCHRSSATLILTDLIENFEMNRIRPRWLRWMMRLVGPVDPDGKAPFDMQLNFRRHRKAVRAAAQTMIDWAPERIILAHGRCYEKDGVAELRRAFRWVL